MRRSRRPIVIASRRSVLARAQAELVGHALARLHPRVEVHYQWLDSEGDERAEERLADAGGKGLFTHRIERAVLEGEADLAVHSLKDLPAQELTPGLTLAAIPRRADARDCLVAGHGAATLDDLPQTAVLGTSSPRRAAQALRHRPDLQVRPIRGNVDTRLRKVLQDGQYDATLLAVAGLQRAGFGEYAARTVDPALILPAACQGALALQCRADDHVTLSRCLPLNDAATATAVHAERQLVAGLEGDCDSPIAALVEPASPAGAGAPFPGAVATSFRVRVRVLSTDGQGCVEADELVTAKGLGRRVKTILLSLQERGAAGVLSRQRDGILAGSP